MGLIMNGTEKDIQYSEKSAEYYQYITEHVNNVKAAYEKLFKDPNRPVERTLTDFNGITGEKLERLIENLGMAVQFHDVSKYSDEEFEGYRVKYFPTDYEKEVMAVDPLYDKLVETKAEIAWHNHYIVNDHHPEHWRWVNHCFTDDGKKAYQVLYVPNEKALPMSPKAILHMICDWEGMSMKFGGNTVDWYNTKATDERKAMHPKTRAIVEDTLEKLYGMEVYRGENCKPTGGETK